MEYPALINGFAEKFAIAGLETTGGTAAVEIDGIAIQLVHDEVANEVVAVAELGLPPPDANGPFGSAMLKANYLFGGTGGAVLCQNPESGSYALMRPWPLDGLDVETFANALGEFVDTAEHWKGLLSGARAAEESAPASAEDLPPDGFMRV